MAKVKTDSAWKRERAELELVNAKKKVAKTMEKFKAFKGFTVQKAQAVVDF